MSTNKKNAIRPEFLKNFTKNIKERFILLEKGNQQFNDISELVGAINQTINEIVQELNLKITDRQLPYITLKIGYGNVLNKKVRVFLHNDDTDYFYEQDIQTQIETESEISHILDLLIATSFKKITISSLSCDAELVIDYKLLKCAIIDILLDIVMFNSYSFLCDMDIKQKKKISEQKYIFYMKEKLPCFYDCPKDKILYYSLSFSARNNEEEFDLDSYINYWNKFIEVYYPNSVHKEKSIKEQIEQHVDYKELPKTVHKKFDCLEQGAYLLLRTNKDRTEKLHPSINTLFGISKYKKGKIKIIPVQSFDEYKPLMENLDVSAFKVVKRL